MDAREARTTVIVLVSSLQVFPMVSSPGAIFCGTVSDVQNALEQRYTDGSLRGGVDDGDFVDDGLEVARRVGDLRDPGNDDRGILGDDAQRAEHEGADGGEDVEELHGCETRLGEGAGGRARIRLVSNGEGGPMVGGIYIARGRVQQATYGRHWNILRTIISFRQRTNTERKCERRTIVGSYGLPFWCCTSAQRDAGRALRFALCIETRHDVRCHDRARK